MKKLIIAVLLGISAWSVAAQEKVYQVDEVSVINYGDGRLLFRQINKDETPLNGTHRIIDGYRSEYILAEFKDGMYNGSYEHFRSNKLKEKGVYKDGRKDGTFLKYYSDGVKVEKETPYKDGKLNGISKSYYTNGELESEKGYAMSVEDGVERKYNYETGKVTTEKNYKNGVQHGDQITHITSNIGEYTQQVTYNMGKPIGEFIETFADGTIKTLGQYNINGRKDGEWLQRDSFSKKDNDKFEGKRIVYKDGKIVEEETIKNFEKFQRKLK